MLYDWTGQEYYEKKQLIDIEYAKGLYVSQEQKVQKEEYIKQLVLEDYVDKIKQHTSRYDMFNDKFFRDAYDEISKKLKKERPTLESLTRFLMKDFLNNDKNFKITKILSCGLEGYGWNIELKGYGETVAIIIPIMRNITTKNVNDAHHGKFGFMVQESESCWNVLTLSYNMEDIAKFIKEYFAEKTNN